MRVRFEARAVAQIADIRDWIAEKADAETADRIAENIIERCESLASFPHRGSPRDDIRPGLRTIPHRRRYTIGYRVVGDEVVVLGVRAAGQRDEVLTNI